MSVTYPLAFMHVLVTCNNEDDSIKKNGLEWSQHFSHCKSMGIFPEAQGQLTTVFCPIWPCFELIRDVMDILVSCKNEEDPIKNEGARMFTTSYINFSDDQGQRGKRGIFFTSLQTFWEWGTEIKPSPKAWS